MFETGYYGQVYYFTHDKLLACSSLPDHGQVRVLDGEIEELVPDWIEAVVADCFRLHPGVVVFGAADLDLDEGGDNPAASFAAQIPE